MVTAALVVRVEAKPGKELDVESLLRKGLHVVDDEPGTTVWFALRYGPASFGIFCAFPDDTARQEHLAGRLAAQLMARAEELFRQSPTIELIDILAAKLPAVPRRSDRTAPSA
jgi:quinol monooxygenase YgiN